MFILVLLILITFYVLLIGVILKNVSETTLTSINKAVTGWLKHAKERYQRRNNNCI